MRSIFNYYLVIRACWPIIFFQVIGWFALVSFAQGQDILKELTLNSDDPILMRHAWWMWLATCWWSWQSFRSARILLHLAYFNFWNFQPTYALQAQVQVPRVLAVIPFLIVLYAFYKAKGEFDSQLALYLSTGLWMYVFLHFRRSIIVWLRTKKSFFHAFIPDYIPIKNGTYPVKFVLQKQGHWIFFRLIMLLVTFFMVISFPITVATFLGSAAIILWGFGTWLIITGSMQFVEKAFRIPVTVTVVLAVVLFSFVNNNHRIRTLDSNKVDRPDLENYFTHWVKSHPKYENNDTITIYLLAGQGGGLRSAYWVSSILSYVQDTIPNFKDDVFCYSGVSGGSLGMAVSSQLFNKSSPGTATHEQSKKVLSKDFLSPVTSWLMYTDILQKFIPIPIYSFDRARALEYSWEASWKEEVGQDNSFSEGFLKMNKNEKAHLPMVLFNATHAENGSRILISNVKTKEDVFHDSQDLFDIVGQDIPLSTAVSISSRFPFLTPPARVFNADNSLFGNVVDGGYFENSGGTTLIELYIKLKELAIKHHFKVNFNLVLIKNAISAEMKEPIRGMAESFAPLAAFTNVWYKSGAFGVISSEKFLMQQNDMIVSINLKRSSEMNIPLGWYLSERARKIMDDQVPEAAQFFMKHYQSKLRD
jgi:hypothetical protein